MRVKRWFHKLGQVTAWPAELERVAEVMRGLEIWWAVAGGWAIDLWLGRQTREHHDIEVIVRRDHQAAVWESLHNKCELTCIDPPGSGWSPWRRNHQIELPSFQVKAQSPSLEYDVFLESTSSDTWIFRRDSRIRRPIDDVVVMSPRFPIVDPAVQLLYMAKSEDPKNQHDFEVARPALVVGSAEWLRKAIATAHPDHPWLLRL